MAQLEKTIRVRVSEDEKRALEIAAKSVNVSESEFIRKFVEYGTQTIFAHHLEQRIKGIEDLNRRFGLMTGVKPFQLVRVLMLLGTIAGEKGKLPEYETLLKALFEEKPDGSALPEMLVGSIRDYDDLLGTFDTVVKEWETKTGDN